MLLLFFFLSSYDSYDVAELNLTLHLDQALGKCVSEMYSNEQAHGNCCVNLPCVRLLYLETLLCRDYTLIVPSFSASRLQNTSECRLSDCDGNVLQLCIKRTYI